MLQPIVVRPRARTHSQLCLTCGQAAWKKRTGSRATRYFCPHCDRYFYAEHTETNDWGNDKWLALSDEGADNLEWNGTPEQLLVELDRMERAEMSQRRQSLRTGFVSVNMCLCPL